jgi:hypothetical protein
MIKKFFIKEYPFRQAKEFYRKLLVKLRGLIRRNFEMGFYGNLFTNLSFFIIFSDSLPESELLEMNDAEQKSKPKDGQRIRGGGGIYAQGKICTVVII